MKRMKKDLPVLMVSGGDDPVGTYGDGVRKLADNYALVGMKDITTKIYPLGRHEILNEINKEDVFRDISKWIINAVAV